SPVPLARRRNPLARRPHPPRGRHASAPDDESLRRRRRGETRERLQSPPVDQVGSVAMAATPGPSRIRVRIVRPDDARGLIPLFEAFYGAYFGGRVTETSVAGRLRQAANHETVIVAEVGDRTGHDDTDSKISTPDTRSKSWWTTPDSSSSTRTSGRALRILKYVLKFGCPSHPGISSMPEEKPSPEPEGPPVPAKPERAERGGKKKDEEKEEPKAPRGPKKLEGVKEDFRYIVRMANTDLDGTRSVSYSLTAIPGVGIR